MCQRILIQTRRNSGTKFHHNLSRSSEHAIWRLAEITYAVFVHSFHPDKKRNNRIHDMSYLCIE
jgi:hypothetical protein